MKFDNYASPIRNNKKSNLNGATTWEKAMIFHRPDMPLKECTEALALGFNPYELTRDELNLICLLIGDERVSPAYIRTLIKAQHYQKVIPLPEPKDFK